MNRRVFFLQVLGRPAELRRAEVYNAENALAAAFNSWAARLDENLRNGIVDVHVLGERKKLEELWKNLWKKVEEWGRGW